MEMPKVYRIYKKRFSCFHLDNHHPLVSFKIKTRDYHSDQLIIYEEKGGARYPEYGSIWE